jgi:hypothetical protein
MPQATLMFACTISLVCEGWPPVHDEVDFDGNPEWSDDGRDMDKWISAWSFFLALAVSTSMVRR